MTNSPPPGQELYPLPVRRRLRSLLTVLSLPFLVFLVLPLVALLLRTSPQELVANLQKPQVIQAILLSLSTSLTSTLVIVIFGTPLALALARHILPFERLIDTLIDMPLVLPPAVAGVA